MNETIAYLPGLSPVENKELCARFDGGRLSSDGGVLSLRGIEKRLGLAARLAGCLTDTRDPASTTHSYVDRSRTNVLREDSFDPQAVTVTIHPVAVGSTEGVSRLDTSLGFGEAFLSREAAQGPEVPVQRLTDVLRRSGVDHVDMLKIDVEGHEPEALSSLLEPENRDLLPKDMIVEYCHQDRWSSDLFGQLTNLGYRPISKNWSNFFLSR